MHPFLTCQNDYDYDSKYVWIFCQDSRGVHGHVLSANQLNLPSNKLIKGCAPCPGHARSSCANSIRYVNLTRIKSSRELPLYLKRLTNDISENEVPASDKCPYFSNRNIAVEVSRASFGNTRSKLGVAQTSQD